MGNPVIHWQVITNKPDEHAAFYAKLFGWTINADNPLNYRMVDTGSPKGIGGGFWPAPPEASPFVQLHVEVEDAAATVERATKAGGMVLIPTQSLPDGSKMAVLKDPHGIPLAIVQPAK